ncbi:DUF374 domain-containing protein [Planctomycetes bacterium K23_9]|uniref:DUF374 domain-containing protein n=1 Tax=Stieleria marina TaxID=1930275 RepID=A0A517NQ38_9BACT|nr:hypothetical protein K239x_11800 [Planctomycetes bacterium K23_9]
MMKRLLPYFVAGYSLLVRWTCRVRVHNDPRQTMTQAGVPHVFAALHAHQVAAMVSADPGTGAMVSRSADGQIIVPALRANGHVPVRGSGGRAEKGGATALKALVEYLGVGTPVILAVDGPRGPRGTVHKGIGVLARKSGAGVLPVLVITNRRIILSKAWDRLQIPLPFGTIDAFFVEPMFQRKGEKLDGFAKRIETQLEKLEQQHDPQEATKVRREIALVKTPSRRAA